MSSVLQSIIEGVLADVKAREVPLAQLESRLSDAPPVRDALSALQQSGISLIAEVKRSSPSKGELAQISDPAELAHEYEAAGASVVSVLTEERRFKGHRQDLIDVRAEISIPVLRKDFIVTEFQILESRIIGADVMLLIVAGLSDAQLRDYHQMCSELGMSVLVEIHDESELERALAIAPQIIGVNSRNLKTLEVALQAFAQLIPQIPSHIVRVAESGIAVRSEVARIEELGADAILVGETLVKSGNTARAIAELLGR